MRSALAVMVALALLTACGALGGTGEGKTNPIKAVFKDPLTTAQIKPALLTLDDMPSGYSAAPEEAEEDAGEGSPRDMGKSTSTECKRLFNALERQSDEKTVGKAEVNFKADEFGPMVGESVSSFEGSKVKDYMAVLDVAFAKCHKLTMDDDGSELVFNVERLSFPGLGDKTVAGRLSAKEPTLGIPFEVKLVIVRVDQNVVALTSFGLGKGMGAEDFEKIARTAVARVQKAAA